MTNFQIERMLDIPISIVILGTFFGLIVYVCKNLRRNDHRGPGYSRPAVRKSRIVEIEPTQTTIEEPVRRYAGA